MWEVMVMGDFPQERVPATLGLAYELKKFQSSCARYPLSALNPRSLHSQPILSILVPNCFFVPDISRVI